MTLLSDAVKIIDTVTKSLGFQANVRVDKFQKDGGKGDPTFSPSSQPAVIERKFRRVQDSAGEMVNSYAKITFTNGVVEVSERDTIILPDGNGGRVVATNNPVDASGRLITEAYLG